MAEVTPLALVTGANRGLGREVCRILAGKGMKVFLTARAEGNAISAAEELRQEGVQVDPRELDVTSVTSIRKLAASIDREFGRLDVLVNNAGIDFDTDQKPTSADLDRVRQILETNVFGVWQMCQAFVPLLKRSQQGRLVNVSSEAGSFGRGHFSLGAMEGAVCGYGVSKAALNALTVKLAAELKPMGILVNAVCPGFTATQPGMAEQGARPVGEGAESIVWAAMLPNDGPTGGFFRDGRPLPW